MTAEQIDGLLSFLEQHPQLAKGHLRDLEGRLRASRLWQEITISLNAMSGATKTVTQWQKVWRDKKYNTKKVVAEGRQHAGGTGGGPPLPEELITTEKKVLGIMGPAFGNPLSNARVPAFPRSQRTNRRLAEGGSPSSTLSLSYSRPARSAPYTRPACSATSTRPASSPQSSRLARSPLCSRQDRSPLASRPDCSPTIARPACSPHSTRPDRSPILCSINARGRVARGRGRHWRPPRSLLGRTSALATGSSSSSISSRLFKLEEERVRAETERAKELREIREAVVALNNTMREFLAAFINPHRY